MKKHLYLLMVTIMVTVMSELQVAGMMPAMAADLGVSTGQIGLLVSVYAAGMAVGGPLFAYFLRHAPVKGALLAIVALYAVAQVLVPLVDAFWWVALIRVITGALAGASFGLSVTYAAQLASSPQKIGEAVSIVLGGIMVGTVLGLPLSHFISDRWGWQSSFYVLGVITFALFLASLALLPRAEAATQDAAAQDVRNLRKPSLWARYLVSLLTIGAAYASFSFFTPLLESNAGFSTNATTIILFVYGICAYIGNMIVGKFADQHAVGVLSLGHGLLFVALVLLAVFSDLQPLSLAMVIVVGFVGVTMNPALVTRVAEVGGAGTMASTIHTAVISAGVTLGSAVSSTAMSSTSNDDPSIAMWTGAVLAILAALALAAQTRSRRVETASSQQEAGNISRS
ncbi:MFS transporter [Arthrobacter sp. EpRS71]|uniref:MFS transporter n=1 Tax=Arthrobacter sp. EpRS71 TaxID=1743141 RepID=UPI0007490C5F|nr:MFS transporter [Arthrobacter sp. EpRS71]KUM42077.1 arabinose ABC transporter permease [Arthrobacter sp. EpRS71]